MEYITAHRAQWRVCAMCKVLDTSEAGYYKHLRRKPSTRDTELLAQIYKLLNEDQENAHYGVRRIFLALRNRKLYSGGYRRILRICRKNGLMIHRKRHPNGITKADAQAQKAENLIKQNFSATKANQKWLTDITEVACKDGKIYLAAVLDCFDGSIRGFQIEDNMRAELCVSAFENACRQDNAKGMILHSDRGSQFTSGAFRAALGRRGAIQSMSSTGRCYDNARMESFFATLKKEKLYLLDTARLLRADVASIIIRYIAYYNHRRIYTPNNGWPPLVFRFMASTSAA